MQRYPRKKIWSLLVTVFITAGACFVYGCMMPGKAHALTTISRESLSFDEKLSDQTSNEFAPVEAIAVARISPPAGAQFGDSDIWMKGLYYHMITKLGFGDIPFNYVVSWQGQVYEGKGGGQDVAPVAVWAAGESDQRYVLLIGYCDNNRELTNSGRSALTMMISQSLRDYGLERDVIIPVDVMIAAKEAEVSLSVLEMSATADQAWRGEIDRIRQDVQVPTATTGDHKGSVSDVEYPEEIGAGESFTVKATVKNEGNRPWYNTGAKKVMVGTSDPRDHDSDFYLTDVWASFTRAVSQDEEWVLPGEEATFTFEISTPLRPGEYSETFEVLLLPDDWVAGTQFIIEFTVNEGDFELAQILETETGVLNVRECPSVGCNQVAQVAPGDVLIIHERRDGWYKLELDTGEIGWVFGKYVKEL